MNPELEIVFAVDPSVVALISVKFRQEVSLPWPRLFEQCAHSTVPAISLINGKSIK